MNIESGQIFLRKSGRCSYQNLLRVLRTADRDLQCLKMNMPYSNPLPHNDTF